MLVSLWTGMASMRTPRRGVHIVYRPSHTIEGIEERNSATSVRGEVWSSHGRARSTIAAELRNNSWLRIKTPRGGSRMFLIVPRLA